MNKEWKAVLNRQTVQDLKVRKPRVTLTAQEKVEIARLAKAGVRKSTLASDFNVDTTVIRRLLRDEEHSKNMEACNMGRGRSKRIRQAAYPELESRLLEVISWIRSNGLPLSKRAIRILANLEKQKMCASGDAQKIDKFSASDGWAMNFIRRHGLVTRRLHGAAASAPDCAEDLKKLQETLSSYHISNIYNMDETGLFYRLMPNRTYILRSETAKTTRGIKQMTAKDRITLYVCTNASGTQKLPLGVIGKSKNPASFRVRPLPKGVHYYSQERAWSDTMTMQKWFTDLLLPFIRKQTSHPVALVLDNASSHSKELFDPKGQVSVVPLPPNTTSMLQPMDAGIISALKCTYRYDLLAEVISRFENAAIAREHFSGARKGTKGLNEGFEAHILDAIEIVSKAWGGISERTIARCWAHTGILGTEYTKQLRDRWPRMVRQGRGLSVDKDNDVDVDDKDNPLQIADRVMSMLGELSLDKVDDLNLSHIDNIKCVQDWMEIEDDPSVMELIEQEQCDAIRDLVDKTQSVHSEEEDEDDEDKNMPSVKDIMHESRILITKLERLAQHVQGAPAALRVLDNTFFEFGKQLRSRQYTISDCWK